VIGHPDLNAARPNPSCSAAAQVLIDQDQCGARRLGSFSAASPA